MNPQSTAAPRRSISAVIRSESVAPSSADVTGVQPRRSLSGHVNANGVLRPTRSDPRRLSLNENSAREYERATHLRRQSSRQQVIESAADLSSYFAFSRRKSSIVNEDQAGLSGFLEYRKLDGSWRPFLFQTIGYQLVVFRVHVTHQVQVMSTDIRDASEISLVDGGDINNTRLFRLGINNTVITLRAVSHHVAMYWIEGLEHLRAGRLPDIVHDRPTIESEDDIFRQIDQLSHLREWRPPPSTETPCWSVCFPCFSGLCTDDASPDAVPPGAAAFSTTHSPRPVAARQTQHLQTQSVWG